MANATRKTRKTTSKTATARAQREANAEVNTKDSASDNEAMAGEGDAQGAPPAAAVAATSTVPENLPKGAMTESPVMHAAMMAARKGTQVRAILKRMKRWDEDAQKKEGIAQAIVALENVVRELAEVRAMLEPHFGEPVLSKRENGGNNKLETGTKVRIRAKFLPKYQEVMEKEELEEPLVVQANKKGMVVCNSCEGARLFIPRGQVEPVDSAA